MSDLVPRAHAEMRKRLGGSVVVGGGAVRDWIMGREPKDVDVFVLGVDFADDRDEIMRRLDDLPIVEPWAFHKSEPYLCGTVRWGGVDVQVMASPHETVAALLDSFDWNVALFAYDGEVHARTDVADIKPGGWLRLQRVTFPKSTLRRGFRFSERFGMRIPDETLRDLCRQVAGS